MAECADNTGEEANQRSNPDGDVTSGRCNTNQTSDGAGACADDREMPFCADVVDKNPAENTKAGGGVGVKGSQHGANSTVQSGTAVEAIPSKPDQNGTDEDKSRIVGAAVNLLPFGKALAEDKSVCKSGPT